MLLGTGLSLVPNITYAQCAVTDCQQLGYTSLKSCDGGLKCPFGEYWACPKVEEKAVLGQCTGYAKNCKIGDILNSDGTCSTDKVSGKTPLGVVVAIKDNCGYAMTAGSIAYVEWSIKVAYTGAYLSSDSDLAIKDFDASGNTQKIIQAGGSSIYPAAWAAVNYAPSAAPVTKGKWVLPSAGMLNSLYTNMNLINNTISKLGGIPVEGFDAFIWSSSETSDYHAWRLSARVGMDFEEKSISCFVRPVLAF